MDRLLGRLTHRLAHQLAIEGGNLIGADDEEFSRLRYDHITFLALIAQKIQKIETRDEDLFTYGEDAVHLVDPVLFLLEKFVLFGCLLVAVRFATLKNAGYSGGNFSGRGRGEVRE